MIMPREKEKFSHTRMNCNLNPLKYMYEMCVMNIVFFSREENHYISYACIHTNSIGNTTKFMFLMLLRMKKKTRKLKQKKH